MPANTAPGDHASGPAPRPAPARRVAIGVDAACWSNRRGYGRFTREILRAMARRARGARLVLFADEPTAATIDLDAPGIRIVPVEVSAPPTRAASAGSRRTLGDLVRMGRAVAAEDLDVVFFPSLSTWFPLPPGRPILVTVHDAIPERHPADAFGSTAERMLWKLKSWGAIRQARLLLTVSEFSAREISATLGVDPGRIRVAGEAPSDAYRPSPPDRVAATAERIGLPAGARWFLYVGGFGPHKRVDALVRSHAALARESDAEPPRLVLVGALDDDFHEDLGRIRSSVEAAGTEGLVVWTDRLPDEVVRDLHTGAVALVLPSKTEGFGLPAVEAAACGTPVVATSRSPLPDLLRGGGWFVDPGDPGALTAAMRALLADEEARLAMGRVARERAEALTWEDAADRALDALHELAPVPEASPCDG